MMKLCHQNTSRRLLIITNLIDVYDISRLALKLTAWPQKRSRESIRYWNWFNLEYSSPVVVL